MCQRVQLLFSDPYVIRNIVTYVKTFLAFASAINDGRRIEIQIRREIQLGQCIIADGLLLLLLRLLLLLLRLHLLVAHIQHVGRRLRCVKTSMIVLRAAAIVAATIRGSRHVTGPRAKVDSSVV